MLSVRKLFSIFISLLLCVLLVCIVYADSEMPMDMIATASTTQSDAALDNSVMLSALFPTDISFFIDAFEMKARGQVYSEEYAIENYGDEDIIVSIESFHCEFLNGTDFQLLDAPFNEEEEESDFKAIYMRADFSSGESLAPFDEEAISNMQFLLKAAEFDEDGMLSEESRVTFSFSGSVNPYPLKKWHDGDVKVHMSFFTSQITPEVDVEGDMEEELEEEQIVEEDSMLQVQIQIPSENGIKEVDSEATEPEGTEIAEEDSILQEQVEIPDATDDEVSDSPTEGLSDTIEPEDSEQVEADSSLQNDSSLERIE